jgi:hypothetical protein
LQQILVFRTQGLGYEVVETIASNNAVDGYNDNFAASDFRMAEKLSTAKARGLDDV